MTSFMADIVTLQLSQIYACATSYGHTALLARNFALLSGNF